MKDLDAEIERVRLKLGNQYWNDNRDYHDSDGVDSAKCFIDGFSAALAHHPVVKMMAEALEYYVGEQFYTHDFGFLAGEGSYNIVDKSPANEALAAYEKYKEEK